MEKQSTALSGLRNSSFTNKIIGNIVLILLGIALIGTFLSDVQTKAALNKQQKSNELALSEVSSIISENKDDSAMLTNICHEGNWKTLNDIDQLFTNGFYDQIAANDNTVTAQIFSELSSPLDITYLYLLDANGKIVMAPDPEIYGRNPSSSNIMTQENLNGILNLCQNKDGLIAPVLVQNQFGNFYFYSKPYAKNGVQYVLAIGSNSKMIDDRVSTLNDLSNVLSRMAVINDGFLFAINKEDGLFEYFKNDDAFLTGQSAFSSGLNEEVLIDGYKGTQIIMGERYYCSSRAIDEDTVIVAAAKQMNISANDKYVTIWSIMGYIIVMGLCMAYAIFVRNDFIRQGTKTNRVLINGNPDRPTYFNKSVFTKVLPLMFVGILVVFGITFYTQTLLEITEGVNRSKVILREISGRYEESRESGAIIEDYYNSRFISTAKLLSFYIEENPDALNEQSEAYYFDYDEKGNRQYVLDDENNYLKSVGNSAILQKLCDDNSIDSIYIYDEDGHTIATNTSNWFFTLSLNENDQSFPFRQVLEGKTDSFTQSSMVDDLGEHAQFFGVVMHYYTTTDEHGNTVYTSRYAFEKACNEKGLVNVTMVDGITKHRSLLQIELNDRLIDTITDTVDPESILSTEMLDGGYIAVFDTDADNTCLYSPLQTSIGRTAKELNISPNAFTGLPYYGISKINGVPYFLHFQYFDGNFFATAFPSSNMYTSRTIISFITAGVCLVMIAALLLMITVSHDEDEEIYTLFKNDDVDEDLNSTIFNIILPSGRSASTMKAANRWDNKYIPWNERSPEMKLGVVMGWIIGVPMIYLIISAIGINAISSDDSIIHYIISGNWDRAVNIFAFSSSIMVIVWAIIVLELIKIPVRQCTSFLGTQGETIAHLLLSIVRYGGVVAVIFYCLYLFGVDSPSLLASAGIMSLVIGFGAQSLIKDVIAGIFIIFESEFRVGDIVTINNFRGTVTDIGLRTTKISGGGNVKIFNNSEISGVLNMTKETSVASATIGLEYGQDINMIEEVFKKELPLLREDNKAIVDGPNYVGVSELAERRFVVTVMARCNERDVRGVTIFLNKSLLQIAAQHQIRIANQGGPKPQTGTDTTTTK